MALVVKMPASQVRVKVTDIDLDFFNSNILDTKKQDGGFLGKLPVIIKFYADW